MLLEKNLMGFRFYRKKQIKIYIANILIKLFIMPILL